MNETKRRLGEVAFIVHGDGSITRTIINQLGLDGEYGFLEHSSGPTFFGIEDAIAQSKEILGKKESELTQELAKVRAKLAVLDTDGFRKELGASALKRVSGSMIGAAFGLDGEAKPDEIVVPGAHFMPGQRVFCVITPKTLNHMHPHYRPYPYFVLESIIKKVRLAYAGRVDYLIDSYYHPHELTPDVDVAKMMLVEAFAKETSGTLVLEHIRLVSHDEEQAAERESSEKIAKQVQRQFTRLADGD